MRFNHVGFIRYQQLIRVAVFYQYILHSAAFYEQSRQEKSSSDNCNFIANNEAKRGEQCDNSEDRQYQKIGLQSETSLRAKNFLSPDSLEAKPLETLGVTRSKRNFCKISRKMGCMTVTDPLGRISTVEKNSKGQVIKETDADGNTISYTYDDRSNLKTKVENIKNDATYTTTYKYDDFNRLIEETNPEGNTASFTYDIFGHLTGSIDFEGNSVSHTYHKLTGWKLSTTRHMTTGDNIKTDFGYYDNGKLKTITDSKGRVTTYAYDDQKRLDKVTYPDATFKKYSYDLNGNVETETQRDGTVITNGYDDGDRLETRSIVLGGVTGGVTSENYSYDGMNRILTASNVDSSISRVYDKLGRIIKETQNGKPVEFGYNAANSLTKIIYPNRRMITRGFDKLNRLKDIKEDAGATVLAEMNYAGKMSRYLSKSYGNGDMVNYLYEQGRRLKSKSSKNAASAVVNNYSYAYNRSGMRTSETRKHEGDLQTNYEYDAAYRLTKLTRNESTPEKTVSYEAKLDTADNILSLVTKKGTDVQTQVTSTNELHQYTQFGDWGYAYDSNGNTTTKGTQKFTYNYRNALIKHVDPDGTTSFKYDVLGRRIAKTAGSNTTNYYYAGNQVIEERNGSDAVIKQYVYGNGIDEVFNVKLFTGANAGTYYYHTDGIGSTTAITDNNGNIVERVKYGIYGIPEFTDKDGVELTASTIGNEYLFQGRRFDKSLNMYHYRARAYDPTTGRFLQTDPLGYVDSMNLYQGMNMNPYNFVDPLGAQFKNNHAEKAQEIMALAGHIRQAEASGKASEARLSSLYSEYNSLMKQTGLNPLSMTGGTSKSIEKRQMFGRTNKEQFDHIAKKVAKEVGIFVATTVIAEMAPALAASRFAKPAARMLRSSGMMRSLISFYNRVGRRASVRLISAQESTIATMNNSPTMNRLRRFAYPKATERFIPKDGDIFASDAAELAKGAIKSSVPTGDAPKAVSSEVLEQVGQVMQQIDKFLGSLF